MRTNRNLDVTERTAAEHLDGFIEGRLLAGEAGQPWKEVLVQIFARRSVQETILVPAVAEPLIVWILSGNAVVHERPLGGAWLSVPVTVGDFYLTSVTSPYEMRWEATGPDPFEVMHLYLGLDVLEAATQEVFDADRLSIGLKEVSGGRDDVLSELLGQLRRELLARKPPSNLFMRGIAQSLAVHIVRTYGEREAGSAHRRSALPAFRLKRVLELMESDLGAEFDLHRFSEAAGLSDFHFSRSFKRATGSSPSQFLIARRMARARQLLLETDRSIIEIGMDVGYSSPSHFAQVFRRETGVTPTDYRAR